MGEILLAAAVVLLDQLSKVFATRLAMVRGSTVVIPGVLGLTCIHNTGASWGILSGRTGLLLAVTGLVCAIIFAALLLHRPKQPLARIALGMVLGGAVGNALDRLADGYVTDMLETLFVSFPIFNVADCFITVGGVLFCLTLLLEERQDRRMKQKTKAETADAEQAESGS